MVIQLDLHSKTARAGTMLLALILIVMLARMVLTEFTTGVLADYRPGSDRRLLSSAVEYYPDSGRLLARLAEMEMTGPDANLEKAEEHVLRAVNRSPYDYKHRLLLARIRELRGNRIGAEQALAEALKLAPNYSETHWKMANFLVRSGKVGASVEHFRIATGLNPQFIPATLDLVWAASKNNVGILTKLTRDNQKAELQLALFLAKQSRFSEAAATFSKVDKTIARSEWESSAFFDSLIKNGYSSLAQSLWLQIAPPLEQPAKESKIWNGSFEAEKFIGPQQFNWQITSSDYAHVGIDSSEAHSGSHSLLFNFSGRDTTALDNEAKNLVVLRPGINYRVEFFVKTKDLKTPEGPRVVISDGAGNWIASSEPISFEITDWKLMPFNFTAPKKGGDGTPLYISIKRKPHYSYDEPTKGRIWFDDFAVKEGNNK